jgi:hypothetical protein
MLQLVATGSRSAHKMAFAKDCHACCCLRGHWGVKLLLLLDL